MSTQEPIDGDILELNTETELDVNNDRLIQNSASLMNVNESGLDETIEYEGGSSSRRNSGRGWFKRADAWLSFASKVFIIAGGIFAVIQFMESKQNHRIAKTFEYIAAYERGPVLVSRENIRRLLRPYGSTFAGNHLSNKDHKRLMSAISAGDAGANIEDDLDRVIDFHEGLYLCLKLELCDDEVAKKYFSCKAETFRMQFMPYIEARRKHDNKNFGVELEWFTSKTDKNNSCEKIESSS